MVSTLPWNGWNTVMADPMDQLQAHSPITSLSTQLEEPLTLSKSHSVSAFQGAAFTTIKALMDIHS